MDQLLGKSIVFDNTAKAKMIHICMSSHEHFGSAFYDFVVDIV